MPPEHSMNAMAFASRAERAIEYGKSSLDSGDTLVILHPEDYKPLDSTGFALNKELRVHSKRLISTGSKKFEKIFSVDVQRAAREFHYADGLPKGIDFILDLRLVAPMNLEDAELSGDVSEQLISELRCSRGIRSWFSSQDRYDVPSNLVGGRDAIAATSPEEPAISSKKKVPYQRPRQSAEAFTASQNSKSQYAEMHDVQITDDDCKFHADMLYVLKISAQEHPPPTQTFDTCEPVEDALMLDDVSEYCPIRYRIGIELLLQIIEGREPTWLDSAPKIWTLYIVAKYFECTSYVTDRISAWMLAPKNELFFEVLPEASLKMGFGLKNTIITRAAFGILVSEEALRISSSSGNPEIPRGLLDIEETRMLRARETLDNPYMDRVQQAGEQFYNRVEGTWQELSDFEMKWLRCLPEWEKINQLKEHLSTVEEKGLLKDFKNYLTTVEGEKEMLQGMTEIVADLEQTLTSYIRGAIIHCLYEGLSDTQESTANYHRRAQHDVRPYLANFKTIYDTFTMQERTMTRFFWQILSNIPLSTNEFLNWEKFYRSHVVERSDDWICEQHKIQNISTAALKKSVRWFNDFAEDAIHSSGFTPSPSNPENDAETFEKFNLDGFFGQVKCHIQGVCQTMLNRGEMDWAATTDTLLCLSDKEWSCLPNWEEREVVIEEPKKDDHTKEESDSTDMSDWDGADDGSMSEWDLLDE